VKYLVNFEDKAKGCVLGFVNRFKETFFLFKEGNKIREWDNWKFFLFHPDFFLLISWTWTVRYWCRPPLEHVQTPRNLLLKATAPVYVKLVKQVRNLFSSVLSPSSEILLWAPAFCLLHSFSLSLFLPLTMIWICAPLVISDSHRHLEIYELRLRVNGRIIALCWNILWKSRRRKIPLKLPGSSLA